MLIPKTYIPKMTIFRKGEKPPQLKKKSIIRPVSSHKGFAMKKLSTDSELIKEDLPRLSARLLAAKEIGGQTPGTDQFLLG